MAADRDEIIRAIGELKSTFKGEYDANSSAQIKRDKEVEAQENALSELQDIWQGKVKYGRDFEAHTRKTNEQKQALAKAIKAKENIDKEMQLCESRLQVLATLEARLSSGEDDEASRREIMKELERIAPYATPVAPAYIRGAAPDLEIPRGAVVRAQAELLAARTSGATVAPRANLTIPDFTGAPLPPRPAVTAIGKAEFESRRRNFEDAARAAPRLDRGPRIRREPPAVIPDRPTRDRLPKVPQQQPDWVAFFANPDAAANRITKLNEQYNLALNAGLKPRVAIHAVDVEEFRKNFKEIGKALQAYESSDVEEKSFTVESQDDERYKVFRGNDKTKPIFEISHVVSEKRTLGNPKNTQGKVEIVITDPAQQGDGLYLAVVAAKEMLDNLGRKDFSIEDCAETPWIAVKLYIIGKSLGLEPVFKEPGQREMENIINGTEGSTLKLGDEVQEYSLGQIYGKANAATAEEAKDLIKKLKIKEPANFQPAPVAPTLPHVPAGGVQVFPPKRR